MLVKRRFKHGQQVAHCEVERVKYRPRRNASIAYRLRLRDAAGKWCYAVTLFLPSQGNVRSEVGTLIYVVPEAK